MKWLANKWIAAAFGLVLAVLVGNAVVSVRATLRAIRSWESVTPIGLVLSEINEALSTMIDIETGQRGYIITGEERFLEPYYRATDEIDDHLRQLRGLTAQNPEQQRRLDELEPLMVNRAAAATETLRLRKTEGFEAAQRSIRTGHGKAMMDEIRRQFAEMEREERESFSQRLQGAKSATRSAFIAFALATLLGLGLLGAVYYLVIRTIAERELAANTLRASEERFRLFMENSPAVASMKDETGRIVYLSAAIEKRFPIKRTDWLGKTGFDLWPEDTAKQLREHDLAVLAQDKPFELIETVPASDGSLRHWLSYKFPVRDSSGQRFVGGMAIEFTDRVRAEQALKAFAAKLERSNRELQDFAYVASHDLQEPLRKILAFGDRLKAKCAEALGDQGRDYLDRMHSAAARMQTLINDLLAFSRVTTKAQPFVPVNVADAAREALTDLEARIEQTGGRVELCELPTIEADPLQIRQLLQNLVGNALKFHRENEPPIVKVRGQVLNGQNGAGDGHAAKRCEITVEDNGIGFDEKYLDRIFNVFQRLHGRGTYEGTGVGLAICRKIAERHGGSITGRSTPGNGATFIVTLPVNQSNGDNGNGSRRASSHDSNG